jgi:hypothetical protein
VQISGDAELGAIHSDWNTITCVSPPVGERFIGRGFVWQKRVVDEIAFDFSFVDAQVEFQNSD